MINETPPVDRDCGTAAVFLLKIDEFCPLDCPGCYFYHGATGKERRATSNRMSSEVMELFVERLRQHTCEFDIPLVIVALHGGEPMAAGIHNIAWLVTELREKITHSQVYVTMQTSGVTLTRRNVRILADLGVHVGVSLDGPEDVHNKKRPLTGGRGSYERTVRGIDLLRQHPEIYAGILTVIHLDADPLRVYEEICSHQPPGMDFLFPQGNWQFLPPRMGLDSTDTPYADWLIKIFDRAANSYNTPPYIRLATHVWHTLLGYYTSSDQYGSPVRQPLCIYPDGSVRLTDAYLSTDYGDVLGWYGRATRGLMPGYQLTLQNSTLGDAALMESALNGRFGIGGFDTNTGKPQLGPECIKCELVNFCGGGHFAHRWAGRDPADPRLNPGFANRSVYCRDLAKLTHYFIELQAILLSSC